MNADGSRGTRVGIGGGYAPIVGVRDRAGGPADETTAGSVGGGFGVSEDRPPGRDPV